MAFKKDEVTILKEDLKGNRIRLPQRLEKPTKN